jgi:hypothetical protein
VSGIERELREAFGARASTVDVGRADEPGLGRRLAAARRRRRARLGSGALAILVVLGALSVVARSDDRGPNVVAGPDLSSTTSAAEPSTTATTTTDTTLPEAPAPSLSPPAPTTAAPPASAAPATTGTTVPRTTTAPPAPVPDDAVWPPPGSATTFTTPSQATTDFARRFLGMTTSQVSTPRVDGANATVELRAIGESGRATGIVSVVSLRRIEGRGWVVLGSAAPSIVVDQPTTGATVASPLTVRGRTRAFEGTVEVEVRRDGALTPIGRSFGTGGGTDVLPFESTVTFARPSTPRGTVVVSEPRADFGDRGPLAATVLRVAF